MHAILLHGYLLRGTGSNIYVANVAQAWGRLGYGVSVLCQDRQAGGLSFVDEYVGPGDSLPPDPPRPGKVRVVSPDIGELLPVYVLDRYEGFSARRIPELAPGEIEAHVAATAGVLRAVAGQTPRAWVLANHVLLGPLIARRALEGTDVDYDVKVHGSALEYALVPHPHLRPLVREGLAGARRIFAGTGYVRDRVLDVLAEERESLELDRRLAVVSPGMDPEVFAPVQDRRASERRFLRKVRGQAADRPGGRSAATLSAAPELTHDALVGRGETYDQQAPDADLADRWRDLEEAEPVVLYFGKFLAAKGIGEIVAAWPEIVRRVPEARLVLVGFGGYREHLEAMLSALERGDRDSFRAVAAAGNFVDAADPDRWFRRLTADEAARACVTGILDHDSLRELLPLASLVLVPSKVPEAFGMVAVEAMAAGVLPLCNDYAGLGDVIRAVEGPEPELAEAMRMDRSRFLDQLPDRVVESLASLYPHGFSDRSHAAAVGDRLRAVSVDLFSWDGIARQLAPPA